MKVAKRSIDVVCAAAGLILTAPLLLAIAAAIRLSSGRPILFRQQRPGLRMQPFTMVKFRSMRAVADELDSPLPDAARLTPLGRFLRSTSLDELPTLWNVLRGDMSLVGPRPLLMEYIPLYSPEQARRHDVLPGVTGWAQVHGRNAQSWDERFALDLWYVDHQTIWLDLKILALTVVRVLTRHGINAPGSATMPLFTGMGSRGPRRPA
jgi:lipopolysaccharide/colanic/teichoic acid biosynthesis glycosyltransferase